MPELGMPLVGSSRYEGRIFAPGELGSEALRTACREQAILVRYREELLELARPQPTRGFFAPRSIERLNYVEHVIVNGAHAGKGVSGAVAPAAEHFDKSFCSGLRVHWLDNGEPREVRRDPLRILIVKYD
jgi:hypothetical protein